MNLQRMADLAAAYGADIGRWPDDERAAAQAFAAQDPRARALLDDMAPLDALLAQAARDDALPGLEARTQAVVQGTLARVAALDASQTPLAPRPRRRWNGWPLWVLAGAALAGCVAGRERPEWLGLAPPPVVGGALADVLDADGARF